MSILIGKQRTKKFLFQVKKRVTFFIYDAPFWYTSVKKMYMDKAHPLSLFFYENVIGVRL